MCTGGCFHRNLLVEEAESKTYCPASGKGCAEMACVIVFIFGLPEG